MERGSLTTYSMRKQLKGRVDQVYEDRLGLETLGRKATPRTSSGSILQDVQIRDCHNASRTS